ncbi:hypothetical protein Pfo_015625, partial [Paulownia fortunei]
FSSPLSHSLLRYFPPFHPSADCCYYFPFFSLSLFFFFLFFLFWHHNHHHPSFMFFFLNIVFFLFLLFFIFLQILRKEAGLSFEKEIKKSLGKEMDVFVFLASFHS